MSILVLFLAIVNIYPLKTPENQMFTDFFRGTLARNITSDKAQPYRYICREKRTKSNQKFFKISWWQTIYLAITIFDRIENQERKLLEKQTAF